MRSPLRGDPKQTKNILVDVRERPVLHARARGRPLLFGRVATTALDGGQRSDFNRARLVMFDKHERDDGKKKTVYCKSIHS